MNFKKHLVPSFLLMLSLEAVSAPEQIIAGERGIADLRVWSSDYYASEYSDNVRITLDAGFTDGNCNFAFFSTKNGMNQAMYSAVLSAQAQSKRVELVLNKEKKILDWCKLESVIIK